MEDQYRWTFFFSKEGQVATRNLSFFEKEAIRAVIEKQERYDKPITIPCEGFTGYVNWNEVKVAIDQKLDLTVPVDPVEPVEPTVPAEPVAVVTDTVIAE